jgi:hypothetical protein
MALAGALPLFAMAAKKKPLPFRDTFVVLLIFLLPVSWLFMVHEAVALAELADPVEVQIAGLDPASAAQVIPRVVTPHDNQEVDLRAVAPGRWRAEMVWVRHLRLVGPPELWPRVTEVKVSLGPREFRYPPDQLRQQWTWQSGQIQMPPEFANKLGHDVGLMNWPTTWHILTQVAPGSLWFLAALALAVVFRHRLARWIRWPGQPITAPEPRWWLPFAAGLALFAAAGAWLEIRQPCYFTQDDNYVQFLPVILQAARSLFEGEFSWFNPYQLLGAPSVTLGTYALTYPVTYLSYALAVALGQESWTLEIFCLLHLAGGYAAMSGLLRSLGIRGWLVPVGALHTVLCGYALVAGRSWFYMTPVFLYVPLLLWALVRFQPSWRWTAGTAVLFALYFHAGNSQMWIYTALFYLLVGAAFTGSGRWQWREAPWALAALCGGAAGAAPLLYWQLAETSSIHRFGGFGESTGPSFWYLFAPLPAGLSSGVGFTPQSVYYAGGLYLVVVFVTLLLALATFIYRSTPLAEDGTAGTWRAWMERNIWLVLAGTAFLLSLGGQGLVWSVLHLLPGFNKFNHAFKFLPFLVVFGVIAGSQLMQRWGRAWQTAALLSLLVLAGHLHQARVSFFEYGARGYPKPDSALLTRLQSGGLLWPIAPERSYAADFQQSLQHNFPMLHGVPSIGGYDPLVSQGLVYQDLKKKLTSPATALETARELGIRWVYIHHTARIQPGVRVAPLHEVPLAVWQSLDRLKPDLFRQPAPPGDELYELVGARPLAFTATGAAAGARLTARGVVLEAPPGRVTVNLLHRPWLTAVRGTERLPARADALGRFTFDVPAGSGPVEIQYQPPWLPGLAGAALLLLAGWILTRLPSWLPASVRERWPHLAPAQS